MIGVPGEDRGVAVCAEDQSVAVSMFAGLYAALQLICHVSSRVSGCSVSSIGDFHECGFGYCGVWLVVVSRVSCSSFTWRRCLYQSASRLGISSCSMQAVSEFLAVTLLILLIH